MAELREPFIAKFCKAVSFFWLFEKGYPARRMLKCSKHGTVAAVAYYPVYANGYVSRDLQLTCLACFEEWIGSSVQPADTVSSGRCEICSSTDSVEVCGLCGKPYCAEHRVEDICNECSRNLDESWGTGRTGY